MNTAGEPESVTHYRRGNAQRQEGRLAEALASYDQAVLLDPGYAHAWCNRGVVQQALGQPAAALASYERAIAIDPQDAMAHYNRAILLQGESRWDEALASYDRAVGAAPDFADAHYNRALARLTCGNFAEGWRGFEWRWHNAQRLSIGQRREFPQPLWLGDAPLAGKRILLYDEGGIGDTIQFCRYAAVLAAQGATVLLQVQAPLVTLLRRMPGVSAVLDPGSALPPFDYHCPLMSLPLACGTTLASIPGPSPYLRADPGRIRHWQAVLGPRTVPRIGIAWSGNPGNRLDGARSIPLAAWLPHLSRRFEWYPLQRDVQPADRPAFDGNPLFRTPAQALSDFDETAALAACLDIVVSVCTSILHLAGALALPAFGLLSAPADWRWLLERRDTPWYPTMTLYRQGRGGDWPTVLRQVAADLDRRFPA